MFSLENRIMDKFRRADGLWWGPIFDVRFYLVSQLQKIKCDKALDIGCGSGIILSEVNSDFKVGIDLSEKALKKARMFNNKFLVLGDAQVLPFRNEGFDMVICANVIELSTNKEEFLKELNRVLGKGGRMFLTTPNKKRRAKEEIKRIAFLDYGELHNLLTPHFKFRITAYQPFTHVPKILHSPRPSKWIRKFLNWISEIFIPKEGDAFFVMGEKRRSHQRK